MCLKDFTRQFSRAPLRSATWFCRLVPWFKFKFTHGLYSYCCLSSQLQQQEISWIHHEINHVSNKTKISITLALCSHNSIILQLTWIVLFDNGKNIQENQVFFFFPLLPPLVFYGVLMNPFSNIYITRHKAKKRKTNSFNQKFQQEVWERKISNLHNLPWGDISSDSKKSNSTFVHTTFWKKY